MGGILPQYSKVWGVCSSGWCKEAVQGPSISVPCHGDQAWGVIEYMEWHYVNRIQKTELYSVKVAEKVT